MKIRYSQQFVKDLAGATPEIKRAFAKQAAFLLENLRHPSLQAKKFNIGDGGELWQGRVNQSWRFYFKIEGDEYVLASIGKHKK